jgi:hypothetical protein
MQTWRVGMSIAALVLSIAGCGGLTDPSDPADAERVVIGEVRWMTFEGGFFAIRSWDGATYDPMSLPAAFQEDGLDVRATLRIRHDIVSFHQAGPIVEVLDISRR